MIRTGARVAGTLVAAGLALTAAACTGSSQGAGSGGSAGAAGSRSAAGAGSSSASGSGTAASAAHKPVRSFTVQGAHASYVVKVWVESRTTSCASAGYGAAIIAYLRAHPCKGLDRYLATTSVDKHPAALSVAILDFTGSASAAQSTALGFSAADSDPLYPPIKDLLASGGRLPGGPDRLPVRRTSDEDTDGARVVVADAWYLTLPARQSASDPDLEEMIESLSS